MSKYFIFFILSFLVVLEGIFVFSFPVSKKAVAQGFQITNLICSNISLNKDSHSVMCDGKYTLVGNLLNNNYNVDLKLIKTFEYKGETQSDGYENSVHSVNKFGIIRLLVENLPTPQKDADILYHVKVMLKDHQNPEYAIGSFSFTIPRDTTSPQNTQTISRITKPFGGKIINDKAIEIQALESANFQCVVPGSSITIYPIGSSPVSYIIPYGVVSKTGTTPSSGQWILGLYSLTKTSVTCIFQGVPPVTTTISLDTISLYGTSK